MKKKILGAMCLSLAMAMTVPLAACGNDGPEINDDGTWWTTTGELNKNGDEVVFEDVNLRLTTIVGGVDKAPFKQIIAQFNAEYNGKIFINESYVGEGEFEGKVTREINQNATSAPDIIMTHQRSMKSFLNYKVIQPYDLAMEETGVKIDLNSFAQGVNQYSDVGTDNQFGVPVDAASMVVYYNKDLLAKYTEKVPQTRTELLKVCDAYAKDTNNSAISWETSGDFFAKYIMSTAVLQNGGHLYADSLYGDWYDDQTQRKVFTDAILSVRSIIDSGYAKLGVHEMSGATDFNTNKSIFYVSMPWYREDLISAYSKLNNLTVPEAEEKIGGASISGWFAMSNEESDNAKKIYGDSHMFAITRKVKDINQKAAICEFVKWFTQRADIGARWAEAGHVTLSNTIAASETYQQNKSVVNFIDNWYPHLDAFTPMGITPYYGDVSDNISQILSEALLIKEPTVAAYEALIQTKQKALNSQIDILNM